MGEVIAGRYEVLSVAGRGGQGEVLRAWDRHHDRLVALKCREVRSGEARDVVLAEARVLLGLEPHPHLPVVRDDFFAEDRHVMVMDWVEGLSLARLLSERGDPGLAPSAVLSLLAQAAEALDHLHGHDPPVVHGDVKPANLIVTGRGRVVLVDFGVATTAGDVAVGGTPGFVAPEVAAGQLPTPAADIYGLAATAFALFTGAAPTGIYPEWEGLDPASVPTLQRALRRGLSIDPVRRPVAASHLVERLQAWQGAELPTGVVTFCLTDLVGSTRLWDSHPEQMPGALARHDVLIAQVVEEHGGRLMKSQGEGDSTLSVFVRASAAAAAALSIQRLIATEPWPETTPLTLRIALHTGEAELRGGDYFGAALNRAARLRGLAHGGQVLVSGATAALVADNLPEGALLADLGEHSLPDLTRPERVFELVAAGHEPVTFSVPAPSVPTPTATAGPRMVGRRNELDELTSALTSATGGRGQVVLVGGEPGIGKTRLLEELATVAVGANAKVFWGRCHEEEGAPAFWPWVRALEDYASDCPTATLRAQLGAGATYLTNLLPALIERLPDVPPPPVLDPKEARFRQFESVTRFLTAASRTQPIVLLFEDLHWADTSTLLLLQFAGQELGAASVLIAGTYRDVELSRHHPLTDTLAELARHASTRRLTLEGLGETDVAAFITEQIGHSPAPPLVKAVVHQTEGNPFFVGEVVRLLSAEDRLGNTHEPLIGIPDSVREVVGRRLNRLTNRTSELLTLASVIGREFDLQTLRMLTMSELDDILDALAEAEEAHLIYDVPGPKARYRFKHALIRQTLYEELGPVRRLRLHDHVAEALERLQSEGLAIHLSELAYHYTEASRLDPSSKAVEYSRRAAEVALTVLAYEDAVSHFERALASLDRFGEQQARLRSELLVSLGEARARSGQLASAREAFWEAATGTGPIIVAEALAGAALGFAATSPIYTVDNDAVELLEAALTALPAGDHPLKARVLARLANVLYLSNDDARLDDLSSEAVGIARRVGEPLVLAEALQFRHGSVRGPGVLAARLAIADEMIQLARQSKSVEHEVQGVHLRLGDLLSMGDISGVDAAMKVLSRLVVEVRGRWGQWAPRVLAMRALLNGELARAEELATESLVVGQQYQDADAMQLYAIQLGGIRREQDRAAEIEPGIRLLTQQMPEIAAWRCALVAILAEAGHFPEAEELLDALARDAFAVLPTDDFRQVSLVMLADACALMQDGDHAASVLELLRPYADECVVLGPALDCFGSVARACGALAALLDRTEEAEAFLRHALDFNSNLQSRRWEARTQVDLGRLLLRRGTAIAGREAAELIDAAERSAEQLGLAFIGRLAKESR